MFDLSKFPPGRRQALIRFLLWLDSLTFPPEVLGDLTVPRNENERRLLEREKREKQLREEQSKQDSTD